MNSTDKTSLRSDVQMIEEAAEAVLSLKEKLDEIRKLVSLVLGTLDGGGKILTAGNGGSAAEAMHFAEEFSGRYKSDRIALPAVSLCSDGTALTCIANDYGFDNVFSRQVEALGRAGDLLVLFSTSGNSPNLLAAAKTARESGMAVAALLGRGGGALAESPWVDSVVTVPETSGAHVQEAHQVVLHIILEHVDAKFAS